MKYLCLLLTFGNDFAGGGVLLRRRSGVAAECSHAKRSLWPT
jgi:hypothetical protein